MVRSGSTDRDRRPEGAAPEHREHGRQQRQPGRDHHDDPERENRAHLAGGVEVRKRQGHHRHDDDAAGGEDRRVRPLTGPGKRGIGISGAPKLVAEARHDQQRVVRSRAEHQHDQDRGRLAADRRRPRLDEAVEDAGGDQIGDRHHREHQQGDRWRTVGQQHQHQHQHAGDGEQRAVDALHGHRAVGVERRLARDVGLKWRGRRLVHDLAQRRDIVDDRVRVVPAVEHRQDDRRLRIIEGERRRPALRTEHMPDVAADRAVRRTDADEVLQRRVARADLVGVPGDLASTAHRSSRAWRRRR